MLSNQCAPLFRLALLIWSIFPITAFGAPASTPEPINYQAAPSTQEGLSDASTAVGLPQGYILVGDDESNVLRVFPESGGYPVLEWNYRKKGPKLKKELDLEASTQIGDTLYLLGSHSNNAKGRNTQGNRDHLFAVRLQGTGASLQWVYQGIFSHLRTQLLAWDKENGHGLGKNHLGLAAAAAAGMAPEQKHGFAIEGMTVAPDNQALWLGFRAPLLDQKGQDQALIIPLNNYRQLIAGMEQEAIFGKPIQLDLGGRGIRALSRGTDMHFIILAGPAGNSLPDQNHHFALFRWDGDPEHAPLELDNDLDSLQQPSGGNPESLILTTGLTTPGSLVHILLDNGDTVWPGQSRASKHLPAEEQRFEGFLLKLGSPSDPTLKWPEQSPPTCDTKPYK